MFLEVELKSQVKSRSRWFSCFEAFCNTSAAAHSGWSLKGRRSGLSWMEIWNSWRLMMWIRKTIPRNWFDTFTLTIGVCFGQAAVRNLEEANTQLNAAVLVLALDRMVMMALMQKSGVSWDAMRCHEMSWNVMRTELKRPLIRCLWNSESSGKHWMSLGGMCSLERAQSPKLDCMSCFSMFFFSCNVLDSSRSRLSRCLASSGWNWKCMMLARCDQWINDL